jgi:signal transduction histidine kinase
MQKNISSLSSSSNPADSISFPGISGPGSPRLAGNEHLLAGAFASFSEAAASLESSYAQLHQEVTRLRGDLDESNQELKSSLEENRRMRQFLNHILEVLPCGVLVTTLTGEIAIANPEARHLLGLPAESDIAGMQIPRWMRNSQAGNDEITNTNDKILGEYECSPDGSKWTAVRRVYLETAEGKNAVLTLRDITQARQLEQLQAELRRREALTEMSALLAHEIRNPLASLELFAGLLAESPLADDCSCWVRHVQAGLRTLAATVNNVLQFRGQPQPELVPTDLGKLLSGFENFMRPVAQQAEVQICLAHDLDNVFVLADRHRLEQVLFNLAWNAFRFMPGGGVLTIRGSVIMRGNRSVAVLSVSDTGCGIPPQNIGKIFLPGFSTRPGSPGLGLAVCKALIEQHGGKISVSSVQEQGTTFHLELRLADGAVLHFPNFAGGAEKRLEKRMDAGESA